MAQIMGDGREKGVISPRMGVEQPWLDKNATPHALWEVWKHR